MLVVAHELRIGSLRYESHVEGLVVRRGVLPIVDRLDVAVPRTVRIDAGPGDDVALSLDAGEGSVDVFTGTVASVRRGPRSTTIVARAASHQLARYRPSLSLEQITVADVITRLCADVGLDTEDVDEGPTLARYVAIARSTALDEVARLAGLAGATATITASGALRAAAEPASEVRLTFGRELLDVDGAATADDSETFTVAGEGAGAPGAPNGLWPTDDFWAGGSPTPGPGHRRRIVHELRSTDAASVAGDAWAARDLAARSPGRLLCWLQPAMSPGDSLEVADAPDDLAFGPMRIRQIVHRIEPRAAATTEVWCSAESSAVGGLLATLGGLL